MTQNAQFTVEQINEAYDLAVTAILKSHKGNPAVILHSQLNVVLLDILPHIMEGLLSKSSDSLICSLGCLLDIGLQTGYFIGRAAAKREQLEEWLGKL